MLEVTKRGTFQFRWKPFEFTVLIFDALEWHKQSAFLLRECRYVPASFSRFSFEFLYPRFLLRLRFQKLRQLFFIVFLERLAFSSQVCPAPHQFATNGFALGESANEMLHQFLVLLEFQ